MANRCGRRALAAFAAAVAGAAMATPASAATQVGETFDPDGSGTCIAGRTLIQIASPGGQYAASGAGVITGWSHRAAPVSAPAGTVSALKLKVARPIGGASYRIVGESAVETTVPGALNVFSTRIPVEAGDVIGFYVLDNGACLRNVAGYGSDEVAGDPPPGATVTLDNPFESQLDVAAILEPDCDADGFGDETQDPELPLSEACGKGGRTVTLDANKNKVKKGKKVRLSGRVTSAARQGPCESGQTVELQRKRPKQTTYTTFAQVQTDAQGSFSLKKKVKKTFEFRAQVVETAACGATLSNSEKVKVKKKRK